MINTFSIFYCNSCNKLKFICFVTVIFFSCLANAQSDSKNNGKNDNKNDSVNGGNRGTPELPQIIPASPKVSSLTRYGEYPVSLYTGLVDITVPVYTIKVRDIEVPIEFKYHASGIKYDDVSLEVGLGWSLIAGGVIDYDVRGSLDNRDGSYEFIKDANNINPNGTCNNEDIYGLAGIVEGNKTVSGASNKRDGESDIYTYSFLQYSGQFCIPYWSSGPTADGGGAVFSSTNPLKLKSLNPFVILDDRGTAYTFEYMEPGNNYSRHWAYYLTKIISADKADTVSFNYTYYSPVSNNAIIRPYIDGTLTITDISYVINIGTGTSEISYSGGYSGRDYYPGRLNSITFRGGKVTFDYYNNAATSRDLRTIKVYNSLSSTPLQTISLVKSQFAGNRGDRLDQVTFQNQQGESYNYQFGYNGNPGTNPGGIDYWGYYNGQSVTGNNFLPNFTVNRMGYPQGFQIGSMNRNANELYMQQGILNKVIYPTKGYTEFKYEINKAWNMTAYGGLRIKEIHNYNSDGTLAEKKWYKYGFNESGQGRAATNPVVEADFSTTSKTLEQYEDRFYRGLGRVIAQRVYSAFPKQSLFSQGSPVVYSYVTEYVGNGTTDMGKTIYEFEDFPDQSYQPLDWQIARYGSVDMPVRTYPWKNGKLKSKEVFKKENNVYTKIYSLTNNYKDINTKEYMNLRVLPYIFVSGFNIEQGYNGGDESILRCYDMPFCSEYRNYFEGYTPYNYFNYYTTTGLHVLDSSTETIDGVTKQVYYDTYNANGFPTQLRTVSSSGKTQQVNYKYPLDLSGNAVYNEMVNRNITAPVIETREYLNNSLTAFRRTQYAMNHPNNANLIAPVSEDYQRGDQWAAETRITYNRYDSKGNLVHAAKDDADKVVYIWGYNHLYPIAEIKGAPYTDVTAKISEATLNAIAAKSEPSPADLTTVNNLRTQLPYAMVTTYTYKPLVGMLTMKDPREVVTDYEYDTFGRLKKVTRAGKVIETYDYHYKN